MTGDSETRTIDGHQIVLSGGRKVWAGECDNSWFIRFDDGKGNERKLRISHEAADALVKLITTMPETTLRYVLTIGDGAEMKWERFAAELAAAVTSQECTKDQA